MTDANLQEENADLRRRLEEAEEAIRAIRSGAVDAFVAAEAHGNRVYTLETRTVPTACWSSRCSRARSR